MTTSSLENHPLSTQPKPNNYAKGLMWFRRDLRINDNAALFYALKHCKQLNCVFIFDKTILNKIPQEADRRVEFIWESCIELKTKLKQFGGDLHLIHANSEELIPSLAAKLGVEAVFTNKDYEPDAIHRDITIERTLHNEGIVFLRFKDQAIFEENEILTQSGKFFSIFTPFKNACMKKLNHFHLTPYPSDKRLSNLAKTCNLTVPSLESMGFKRTNLLSLIKPGEDGAIETFNDFLQRIDRYKLARDFPSIKGVSYLSMHNRFGTISIRRLAKAAFDRFQTYHCEGAISWFNELLWRDFYFQIIYHRPDAATSAFKPEYDQIQWENGEKAEQLFKAWCNGKTGYPLVDAAQRQLNQTGFQHNRLRMVTASFLTKHLGIDWRWGEKYFADHLNDFDLSANNGGWQWAASSGCDAQPYFRIFNPYTQSEKFDAEGKFIRKYCPELANLSNKQIHNPSKFTLFELKMAGVILGETYPTPIVEHNMARQKTLDRYALVKKANTNNEN
jgi:deoxyribodipyrimidine photo-lyase